MNAAHRLLRAPYLEANETFYSAFWRTAPNYGAPFPNAEEAVRGAAILRALASVAEREGWAARRPRILDAGCGRGWLTNLLSLFGEAEGCDPVADAVALAESLFPLLRFRALTPGELAAEPGFAPFDVVVCSEVLEHVPAALQDAFVHDLHNCLRAGGILVLTTPRGERRHTETSAQQALEVWLTEREVELLLVGSGFAPLERSRACPTGGGPLDRIMRWMPGAVTQRVRTSWIQAALDHHASIYQIWCCRRG